VKFFESKFSYWLRQRAFARNRNHVILFNVKTKGIDIMTLTELQTQLAVELEVNEDNVMEKSLKYSSIYHKYTTMYFNSIKELGSLKVERDKIYGELYHTFKTGKNPICDGYDISTKGEIDIYVRTDPKFCTIQKSYSTQESLVKFLEMALDNINKMSFNIKNFVEIRKLRMGI